MIAVNQPLLNSKTRKNVLDCIDTGWISGVGRYVDLFEQRFASFIGVKHAISTNSGTTALHLALLALDIKKGDEIILPASTIASCFFVIWYCGAKAVPVDVDPITFNINTSLIENKITARTKAIMVVHLYGYPADMDRINRIAKKHNLKVIEDASQAHGAEYNNKKVGSLSDVACFSLYANKIVTTGEGGIIVTNNSELYRKAKQLKGLNCLPTKRFIHLGIGYRYDMTNIAASIGESSLCNIKKSLAKKQKMARLYASGLKKINGIVLPPEPTSNKYKRVYWMYTILVKEKEFGMNRDTLSEILFQKYAIQTRGFFYPPNIAFKAMRKFQNEKFPVSEVISEEGLYLPSGLGNSVSEFNSVIKAIKELSSS